MLLARGSLFCGLFIQAKSNAENLFTQEYFWKI